MNLNNKIVRDQALLRHRETEARRKVEIALPNGDGNIITGSIFDCNRKNFEKMLRAYWDRLYVGWNPYKEQGRGCWEVWSRPSQKTAVISYESPEKLPSGNPEFTIVTTQYKPNDYEHWVADLPFLSYDFIKKLREMDGWENKNQVADHDHAYEQQREKADKDEEEHLKYIVRHNKQAFRDLLDYTQQGYNPLDFFNKK